MGILDTIRHRNDTRTAQAIAESGDGLSTEMATGDLPPSDSEKPRLVIRDEKELQEHPDEVTSDAQTGVQKAEAAALVWSKTSVFAIYAWIWVCFFMLAFHSAIGNNVLYNAYSNFQKAPQVATANILSSVIGGVLKLPIAKVINIWGRAEGFVFFVVVYVLGIIVIASCTGPNGYAAGYTLYWVGYSAIYLILDIFMADTTGLRNRAFAFGFASTPFICTAFVGPLAAQSFILHTGGWRWAYGAFAIIMPFVFLPLAVAFKFYERKARKMGIYNKVPSGRTTTQSIVHYIHEFDVIGAFILMAGFLLFLLPFSLNTNGRAEYSSGAFIGMVVVGILLLIAFPIWERYFARVHFIPWELLKQRTVLGAFCLAALLNFSFYSWDLYYYYFVMVVYDLNISMTGYMSQIYNIGSCFWGVIFGLWVRYTNHFKYICLLFGVPLMILGAGLMVHFRGSDQSIGYIVMCQIFIAFAGGTLVIGEDMAVMAAADRNGVPLMLSLLSLSASLGGSIGYAVSAAINSNTFPGALESALPEAVKFNATVIYNGGYSAQLLYPVGSETRDAINYAWGYSQKYGCITSAALMVLAFPCIAVWKNYSVDKKQNKGTLL